MSKAELRSALIRAIVLEYQNGKQRPFPSWGWEKPKSMFVLRRKRFRLASEYAIRHEPVSSLLFARRLPYGKDWPGTGQLVPAPMFGWRDGEWTQTGSTVPYNSAVHTDALTRARDLDR